MKVLTQKEGRASGAANSRISLRQLPPRIFTFRFVRSGNSGRATVLEVP